MKKQYLVVTTLVLLIVQIACKSLQNEGGIDGATVEFSIDASKLSNVLYSSA